ncbi:hypothetical protein GCM10022409_48470 [Hymenobacter glaciei]|uniref:SnoaL-like domain-containing protein n=1 Tax=Hymenobacter glaciei TaxID=877209 RepID=A0ABP7UYD1_9BACT
MLTLDPAHAALLDMVYHAFNARNVTAALALMQPDVEWSSGFKGQYLSGYEALRNFWTTQWQHLDVVIQPLGYHALPDGRVATRVSQLAHDVVGAVVIDNQVTHIYEFEGGLIKRMNIKSIHFLDQL